MRKAEIKMHDITAGWLTEDEHGYHFEYASDYLTMEGSKPVSLTLPLREEPHHNSILFPFFDGLIPEGWLLDIAQRNWKLDLRDRMGLLLSCCKDCIGAASVHPVNEEAA